MDSLHGAIVYFVLAAMFFLSTPAVFFCLIPAAIGVVYLVNYLIVRNK